MKRFLALACASALLFLAACTQNGEPTQSGASTTAAPSSGEASAAETTTAPQKSKGILAAYQIRRAAELYSGAANKVKEESAGFTKTEWQSVTNIETPDTSGLADRILDILLNNVVVAADNAAQNAVTVPFGSTQRIQLLFPVYNQSYAAALDRDYGCISSAEYKKEKGKYSITLHFNETVNAERGDPGFGSIMVPFKRADVLDTIRRYVVFADLEKLALDFHYRDCYLTCVINASQMRLESLELCVKADVSANADFNVLGIVKTDVLNGTATVESHILFEDFIWE